MRLSTRRIAERQGERGRWLPAEARFSTPWGEGLVTVWQGRLVGVELPPVRATAGASHEDRADRRHDREAAAALGG